ncbi:carboxymuconolactone decarboxylase family protein [Halorubrum salsamenti]|uniref:carboxymuconolactone decarboxylase family protein n=1 Tax=Halorubrum salsamenti TaxID=2583990 RepID=UPI0011A70630|nr:alkylhydroperoxidase [Halorubrum salsamenti]
MSSETVDEVGPRVTPKPPETVQEILKDAPDAAQANMERAEAILGALDENDVPEKYDTEGEWGFAFTGVLAQHPETFKNWWAEEGQVFEGGNLSRGFKELLGAVVAHERGAAICIAWHTTSAAIEDVDADRFAIAADFDARKDELPEDERVAIEFARKSVESPADVTDADVAELRAHGYDDADIVELTTTAGTAAKFANFALTLDI